MDAPFEGPPSHVRRTGDGEVEVWTSRPGWLLSRASGRFTMGHCDELLVASDRAVSFHPKVRFVHDWRRMGSFEIGVPPRLVAWVLAHARAIEQSTIVIHSPMVAMAARAANVTLKNTLFITGDDAALDRALATYGT